MMDELSASYTDLLDGSYDCMDRVVLRAYNPICYEAGGFRHWWRQLCGSDESLDDTHLIRMAGRFSRRVRGFAKAKGIPLIDCSKDERKHEIAEDYLREHPTVGGLFMILVARAVAPVWQVQRSKNGKIRNIAQKRSYVNHYSFHIMDPDWGHLTIKMSGHPPFGAQVMLNGHEYVACQGAKQGLLFTKEGNCFTGIENVAELVRVADTLSEDRTIGLLSQLCDRWIYTACLCFALDSDEQERTGFRYRYSVYQGEYSRNLIFQLGGQMEQVLQGLVDRNRARLDIRHLNTIFGAKRRPRYRKGSKAPRVGVVVEKPTYDLTVFKLHFGKLTLKVYAKGERVLRIEAITHNARALRCGQVLEKFPAIVAALRAMLERFLSVMHWVDAAFIADDTLNQLPTPSQVGKARVGGVDVNTTRMRAVLAGVLALAPCPTGFTAGQLATKVREITGQTPEQYRTTQAAYDLKKLRGKNLVVKSGSSRRHDVHPEGVRTIAALSILREQVLRPLIAAAQSPAPTSQLTIPRAIDDYYQALRTEMRGLFAHLHLAAA